jgi:hypothetical protein
MGPVHSSLARCSFFCLACLLPTQFPRAGAQSPQETPLYKQATAPIEARITDLLQRMTVEEKARQSPKDASCLAIRSGVDMQFYDFPHDVFQKALVDCVREGSLPQSDLDRAVRSVLRVKFALGQFSVSVGGSSEASLTAEFRL